MPHGGARPGAGRKRKTAPATPAGPLVDAQGFKTEAAGEGWPFGKEPPGAPAPPPDLSNLMPLDYFLEVLRNPEEDKAWRMQAATLAAPYCHPKKGEVSKKAEAQEKAKAAGAGRFATRKGPQLAAAGGKRL